MTDGWLIVIGVVILAVPIVAINVRAWRRRHEWHASPWPPLQMRRKINGRWQYREMTSAEKFDEVSSRAW